MSCNPNYDVYKQFAGTPDKELEEWEKFVTIRKLEMTKLGNRTLRQTTNLVMQGCEKIRAVKEWKQVIEDAEFSKQPIYKDHRDEELQRLHPRCVCGSRGGRCYCNVNECICCQPQDMCTCYNVYEVVRSKLRRGIIEPIEHIGCPDYILQTEKGIFNGAERKRSIDTDFREYRAHRENVLKKEIKKFVPFRSDLRDLVIIGSKPQKFQQSPLLLPNITIDAPINSSLDESSGIYALRINNTILIKDFPHQIHQNLNMLQKEPWHETCTAWTYYLNNPQSRLGEAKLVLQNYGTVAIKYCWQKLHKQIPFIPEGVYEQKFFFDKSENVISPGQCRIIYFTFLSEVAGIFNEMWKFNPINISFFDNTTDRLTIELIGDSTENIKKIIYNTDKLQYKIERKVTKKFVYDFIYEIIGRATEVKHQYYPYKNYLLEADLFVTRNNMCYYHQTEVELLKKMFHEMTNEEWDLYMPTWRQAMTRQPFDKRMYYYDHLKKTYRILLKPWHEGESVREQKYRAVNLLIGRLANMFNIEKERVLYFHGVPNQAVMNQMGPSLSVDGLTADVVRNVFFLRMYDHVAETMELIAGLLSSIDLCRWIDFDFCQT